MIRIGIAGYGNLGRGVESALSHTEDMELVGVFTRRSPDSVKTKTGVPVYSMEQAKISKDEKEWYAKIKEKALVIQFNNYTLKLPYNISVSNGYSPDISLVEYIGRKHPVSYYGTQLGETMSWKTVIPKSDHDTLNLIRELAIYMGDVYVREPSGTGYWANISVDFSQSYDDLTIPLSFSITRVEGGM